MKIVCISDTHEQHRNLKIPEGDVLIHAGDITWDGRQDIYDDFNSWLGHLSHKKKFVIPGNHDAGFAVAIPQLTNATVLIQQGEAYGGLFFWGYPYTPAFGWTKA